MRQTFSLTGTTLLPVRDQQSTDEYRPPPQKPTFRDVSIHAAYSGIKLKAHDCRRGMTPTTVNLSTLTDLTGDSTEPTNVFSSGSDYELPTENDGNSESAGQNHSAPTAGEDGTAAWLS